MGKKELLSQASAAVKEKKTSFLAHLSYNAKRPFAAIRGWFHRRDKLQFFNILLLALVCTSLFVMRECLKPSTKSNKGGYTQAERARVDQLARRLEREGVAVVSRNNEILVGMKAVERHKKQAQQRKAERAVVLPIRQAESRRTPEATCKSGYQQPQVVRRKTLEGNIVVEHGGGQGALAAATTVNGSLYLQNMRTYTLPCGVRVNGDLFLRNVNLLRFCGEFTVKGNIYVSSNSSFGPIPKNARLGGQVIF
jgi:hypothetical protein